MSQHPAHALPLQVPEDGQQAPLQGCVWSQPVIVHTPDTQALPAGQSPAIPHSWHVFPTHMSEAWQWGLLRQQPCPCPPQEPAASVIPASVPASTGTQAVPLHAVPAPQFMQVPLEPHWPIALPIWHMPLLSLEQQPVLHWWLTSQFFVHVSRKHALFGGHCDSEDGPWHSTHDPPTQWFAVPVVQSASWRHCTHTPMTEKHLGVGAPQPVSSLQPQRPSPRHCWHMASLTVATTHCPFCSQHSPAPHGCSASHGAHMPPLHTLFIDAQSAHAGEPHAVG
jgi:hypothetical protein